MCLYLARLAQSVEHGTLNPRVVGSSPTLGDHFCLRRSPGPDHGTVKVIIVAVAVVFLIFNFDFF